ncbi:MAG: glycosyl hydrolase, partial [Gammaproteobacteria bacterium]|nr:glycosyl hydrolase [Gammaproteobacteria bacterium]
TNPDVIYAAAYERRRHVWGLLAGGPNGGIYKSSDGGGKWARITTGLPEGDVGKIGLAVTLANPDLVYATIEADSENRGFYRSSDQGESWVKKNSYISGGTGPHYYQELTASPQTADLVYQMDVFMHVTRDGGSHFDYLGTGREKHSDNHAFWVDPKDDLHMLAGTDAGLYESFDQGTTWRHFPNLPISQFYKVALDNDLPFYNLLGGAQDLGTLFGPTRTMTTEGVRNQDWYVPLGADGYNVAFDPEDPNISYMEYQQGYMYRHYRDTNELVHIQPQPNPGEAPERWNWDTPILISPHKASRLYVGSQRVWQSDDRGNSWQAISKDLTTNQNRYELAFNGRVWSVDDLHDNDAMSKYSTLTVISESPVSEGVVYTGSDDGLIHVTSNGGSQWQRAKALPDVPDRSFINDIEASLYDADTVYAVADAHKTGDFSPYVFASENQGRNWRSISGDLPDGTIVWAIQQDHENENLLFLGTEFGIYFSINGGTNWHKTSGAPTIAFRDIKIQRRDNDLVGASFGRGFYVLDDYSSLRTMGEAGFGKSAILFPIRDAWWYIPSAPSQAAGMPTLGSDSFKTANPEFGTTITYYLDGKFETGKDKRKDQEVALSEKGEDIPFPGWDRLTIESLETSPRVMMLISDSNGQQVRWLEAENEKGTHRVAWDLRLAPVDAIDLRTPSFVPPWAGSSVGPLVAPGEYSAQLFVVNHAGVSTLTEIQRFTVKAVHNVTDGVDYEKVAMYQQETAEIARQIFDAGQEIGRSEDLLQHMRAAAVAAPRSQASLFEQLDAIGVEFSKLSTRLNGDTVRGRLNETSSPSISGRAYNAANTWHTTHAATVTQRADFEIARSDFAAFSKDLASLLDDLAELENELEIAGAPSWR